jgi:hypothetical protein
VVVCAVRHKALNARSVKLWDGTGDNDGIPQAPPPPAPNQVLAVRDSNIPAAIGVVDRSLDNAGENNSTGGETVKLDNDGRDVSVGLDANNPFAPIGLAGNLTLPPAHDPYTPVATAHGVDWYKDDFATMNDIVAAVVAREWHCKTLVGNIWRDRCDPIRQVSRLNVFL